jgi:hypothetical protein
MYSPSQAHDAERAKSLAVSFRDNTAGKTLSQIGQDSANSAAIRTFQDAAGISVDGRVGPQTLEAYGYYIGKPVTAKTSTPIAKVSLATLPVQQSLFSKVKTSLPAFPVLLSIALIGIGVTAAIYKASK